MNGLDILQTLGCGQSAQIRLGPQRLRRGHVLEQLQRAAIQPEASHVLGQKQRLVDTAAEIDHRHQGPFDLRLVRAAGLQGQSQALVHPGLRESVPQRGHQQRDHFRKLLLLHQIPSRLTNGQASLLRDFQRRILQAAEVSVPGVFQALARLQLQRDLVDRRRVGRNHSSRSVCRRRGSVFADAERQVILDGEEPAAHAAAHHAAAHAAAHAAHHAAAHALHHADRQHEIAHRIDLGHQFGLGFFLRGNQQHFVADHIGQVQFPEDQPQS